MTTAEAIAHILTRDPRPHPQIALSREEWQVVVDALRAAKNPKPTGARRRGGDR